MSFKPEVCASRDGSFSQNSLCFATEAEALTNRWAVSIAIVDDGGHLLWLQRLDGSAPVSASPCFHESSGRALPPIALRKIAPTPSVA